MYQVSYFLTMNSSMHPDRLALVCEGREYTWRELNEEANRLARALLAAGLKKGDRLAFMFGNIPEFVTLFYATQKIGVCALALNTHFLSDEIIRISNLMELKALFYQKKYEEIIRDVVNAVPTLDAIVCREEGASIAGASSMSEFCCLGGGQTS